MIHFFHGQFDHPTMWNNYKFDDHSTKIYNLYDLTMDEINSIRISSDDILVGYSLGGRVALRVAVNNSFDVKKVILLSSHPGLEAGEIQDRILWEEEIILRLRTSSLEDFFTYWNSLPLFHQSQDYLPIDKALFKKSISLFENHRLSNQPNFLEEMNRNRDKILYVFGYQDRKYSEIAWNLALRGIKTIGIQSDHRVHLKKKHIQEIINSEITS
jgi:2-succinyl-6-hydroxy-2,4-cyclohexadiene-1-carboxylate synthase